MLVQRQEQLDELCARARAERRFAFDTEFVMEDCYETDVCLIQIATAGSVAIVDPFLDLNLRGVWDLVCDERVETVVHAGQEDLALCVQHTGNLPRCVFDVQIAAGLVGHDYPLSLQKLTQTTMHIRLHKSKTLTDWRKRPLTAEQIRYAAEDVCHLLAIRQKLHNRLVRFDRVDWAREEFARFEEMSLYRRAEEDKLTRLKGSGSLKGLQLAIVHEILTWRETLAEKLNRPLRAVLRDHLIVEIAKLELSSFGGIRDLRGINLSDRHVRELAEVVRKAGEIPSEQWPAARPRDFETPREAALVALATAVLRGYCLDHDLAYGLLASKKSIHELIRHRAQEGRTDSNDVGLLEGWRGKSAGALLDDVLAGRRAVRVASRNGETALQVDEIGD